MDVRLGLATGAALLLAACGVGSTPTAGDPAAPSTAPSTAGVVPWADLPAAHERIPATRVPASPDPAAAQAAPRCTADQLRLDVPTAGAAAGTVYQRIALSLARGPACAVSGRPRLSFSEHGRALAVPQRASEIGVVSSAPWTGPVLVTARSRAVATWTWSDAMCASASVWQQPTADRVTVTLVGGGSLSATPQRPDGRSASFVPTCYGDGENGFTGIQPIGVTRFSPERYRPATTRTPWDGVAVRMRPWRLRGSPGSILRFTVVLTAAKDLPLDVCPDYEAGFFADRPTVVSAHQLNCAAVPFRLADGTPYLPAHTPVRFAMRATAPPPGPTVAKLGWELASADGRVILATAGLFRPLTR